MTPDSFGSSLVRKSERAIRSARLSLRDGDADSAVNRAYYAMFNVARAALLSAGIPEGALPRTHRGVMEAFRIHAVQTGRIEAELASILSRTESLRLKADYTATEIDPDAAKQVVASAEQFLRTVERVFGLGGDTTLVKESSESQVRRPSLEETRRQAAEDWRQNYYEKRIEGQESAADSSRTDKQDSNLNEDADLHFDPNHER